MLFIEIIAVFCENNGKHVNTLKLVVHTVITVV